MYFAVAKQPRNAIRVGTIVAVSKGSNGTVDGYVVDCGNVPFPLPSTHFNVSKEIARDWFTRPSSDFDDVVEQAISVCEAAFC